MDAPCVGELVLINCPTQAVAQQQWNGSFINSHSEKESSSSSFEFSCSVARGLLAEQQNPVFLIACQAAAFAVAHREWVHNFVPLWHEALRIEADFSCFDMILHVLICFLYNCSWVEQVHHLYVLNIL